MSDFTFKHLQKSILKRLQRNNSGDPALGALTMPNGDKYVGQFRDGKPNGRGVITWDQGQPAAVAPVFTTRKGRLHSGLDDFDGKAIEDYVNAAD